LELAGAHPRSFDPADLPESGAILDCSVLLVHVREETMDAWCISPGAKASPHMPLILVGRRERILAVDRSVLARAREFLIDGWQPEEALMRVGLALSRGVPAAAPAQAAARPASGEAEILIADDDPVDRRRTGTASHAGCRGQSANRRHPRFHFAEWPMDG